MIGLPPLDSQNVFQGVENTGIKQQIYILWVTYIWNKFKNPELLNSLKCKQNYNTTSHKYEYFYNFLGFEGPLFTSKV